MVYIMVEIVVQVEVVDHTSYQYQLQSFYNDFF